MSDDQTRALRIARRHGLAAESAELLPGVVNVVARVHAAEGADVVVRFPADRAEPDAFATEEWAYRAAAAVGIPSPRVLERGDDERMPYLVLEYVEAIAPEPADPWTQLGHYAALIARIPVDASAPDGLFSRFGRDLPHAWREHLSYNIASLTPDDAVMALGVYDEGQRSRLIGTLQSLTDAPLSFGLCHGDLAPRNLIPHANAPVLIDWGAASTGPTPWTDVQRVFQWSVEDGIVTQDQFRAFAAAAGVDVVGSRTILDALIALRHLDLVRWALAQRPDLVPDYVRSARNGLALVLARADPSA